MVHFVENKKSKKTLLNLPSILFTSSIYIYIFTIHFQDKGESFNIIKSVRCIPFKNPFKLNDTLKSNHRANRQLTIEAARSDA